MDDVPGPVRPYGGLRAALVLKREPGADQGSECDPDPDPDEVSAWLRLIAPSGLGTVAVHRLLGAFGMPQQVLAQPLAALAAVVPVALARALLAPPDAHLRELIARTQAWLRLPGNHMLTLADAAYPHALLDLADPPPVLYVKGKLSVLRTPALAMVGARSATVQGMLDAEEFARTFSDAGLTVVSGLALGIDAAAHAGGLDGPGGTIAVTGTGVDLVYPARNRELAHRVVEHGAIVSEFALGTRPRTHHFPQRNRLIAALSRGVLVVEAAERSGSLITARLAAELGREVFAMPGSIHAPLARGCHALIRSGAKLVESAQDVLEELSGLTAAIGLGVGGQAQAQHLVRSAGVHGPTGAARGLAGTGDGCTGADRGDALAAAPAVPADDPLGMALAWDPIGMEALCVRSGLSPQVVAAALLDLELAGKAERLAGNQYRRLVVP